MAQYNIGDTVKLVSKRPIFWNPDGRMDCFLGSIQKIKSIDYWGRPIFENPDTHQWGFRMSDVESLISSYPKVMWVRDDDDDSWRLRVVFMEKAGKFIAWACATTIEDAEKIVETTSWSQAKEVQPTVELTITEIAEKFGILPEHVRIKE